jgi:hypothetical protein
MKKEKTEILYRYREPERSIQGASRRQLDNRCTKILPLLTGLMNTL